MDPVEQLLALEVVAIWHLGQSSQKLIDVVIENESSGKYDIDLKEGHEDQGP